MKIKLHITQKHIDKSKGTGSTLACPIALALTELGYSVAVGGYYVSFYEGEAYSSRKILESRLPHVTVVTNKWLLNPVPISFMLQVPTEVV